MKDDIKISVLIPMYNRKHYIEQCVGSVLAQNFKDIEVVIVDDGSTDGSYEYCEEKFGRFENVRLLRNPKNMGETPTTNRLMREARGKYFHILHSDDVLLTNALKSLYEVAESTGADVVHHTSHVQSADENGSIIKPDGKFYLIPHDRNQIKQVTVMPDDPRQRLTEWITDGTFIDPQYNLFNREFMWMNNVCWRRCGGHPLFTFLWIMSAKVYVKVPFPAYIYRQAPDSLSNKIKAPENVLTLMENYLASTLDINEYYDHLMSEMEIFKDNEVLRDCVKMHAFFNRDNWIIWRAGIYKEGITAEIYEGVHSTMKKYFGRNAYFPELLFHIMHEQQFNRNLEYEKFFVDSYLKLSSENNMGGGSHKFYLLESYMLVQSMLQWDYLRLIRLLMLEVIRWNINECWRSATCTGTSRNS